MNDNNPLTFTVHPPLHLNPQTCLRDPDGSLDFGFVPEVKDLVTGERLSFASAVRLQHGNKHLGFVHVRENHEAKISEYYRGLDPLTYVSIIAKGYQKIYLQKDRSLFLLKFNGVVKSAVVAKYHRQDEEYYRVVTAYPLERLPPFAKRGAKLIWEK